MKRGRQASVRVGTWEILGPGVIASKVAATRNTRRVRPASGNYMMGSETGLHWRMKAMLVTHAVGTAVIRAQLGMDESEARVKVYPGDSLPPGAHSRKHLRGERLGPGINSASW
jgi:hypothetical protein